ncbi:MAG: acetyltransferase, family, partial [Eubacterium sp.]|nr:acetyltransferase, family [Eubacterium sp.]
MEIEIIRENKKRFLDLLLLADEQESMIDKYLERGEMFAL